MAGYNGFSSYETWNVCLWLQNDYRCYKVAQNYDKYLKLIPRLEYQFGRMTPDGVRWRDGFINTDEVDEVLADL